MSYATLTNTNFSEAIVAGVDFSFAGLAPSQLYSTASYKAGNLQGIALRFYNLTGWNFSSLNLSNANLYDSTLTNANFSNATVTAVNFDYAALTSSQLYSTASYKAGNLQGVALEHNNLAGWNLSSLNLNNADLSGSTLTNANFTNSTVVGANFGSTALTSSQLYSTASYKFGNLQGTSFASDNLAGWNLSNQNLIGANLTSATLTGVNLTNAAVTGANFAATSLTCSQLYTTASYKAGSLQGVRLYDVDMTGWDLSAQNLSGADFSWATLVGTNLTGANLNGVTFSYFSYPSMLTGINLTGADMRGATGISFNPPPAGAITTNTIFSDGTIQCLTLCSTNATLLVRNYSGTGSIPIHVQQGMSMTPGTSLVFALDGNAWGSTISFDSGIPITLDGGNLVLGLAPAVSSSAVVGTTVQLFNWAGAARAGQLTVVDNLGCPVDTSQLYSTGNVSIYGHAAPSLTVSGGSNQTVIVSDAGVTVGLTLSNGTQGQIGLAALDVYSLGLSVTGSTGSKLVASGASQLYTAALDTSELGSQNLVFSLNVGDDHTLPGASPATNISTTASLTVYDHANASLCSTATQTTQTINFGNVLRGANVPAQNLMVYNLAANTTANYTANLKLTGSTSVGDAAFSTNLAAFSGLTAASGSNGNTFTAALNTANYTTSGTAAIAMSASQLADDSSLPGAGGNNNGGLTVTLVGNVGNATADASNSPGTFGPALTAPVAAGGTYANLESTVKSTTGSGGGGPVGTTATILGGTNSSAAGQTVSVRWRTRTTGADAIFASDILNLSGLALDGSASGQTAPYVLQMSYDAGLLHADEATLAADEQIGLDWLNPLTGQWENAVDGDFGVNQGVFHDAAWQPADLTLGDWGVNTVAHTVWAVVDHDSQFAVVPEPGTLALVLAGGVALAALAARRRIL